MTNSDLPRVTQKIFGENAGQNIGQFGSALTGTPNRTGDISQIQALNAWSAGWEGAVLPTRDFPALEEMTGVQKVITQQLAYFFQKGFPEWDANTTYFATKSFAQVNGVVYQSLTDNNKGNNPTTSPTNWKIWDPDIAVNANVDLSNLSGTGENHFANPNLSNITDTAEQHIDTVTARPLSDNACTQENFPDEFDYWYNQKYTTFNKGYISTIGTPTMSEFGVISNCGDYDYFLTPSIDVTTADSWEMRFTYTPSGTTPTTAIGLFGSNWLNVSFTTANKITATLNYSGGSLTLTSSGTFATEDKIFCKLSYGPAGYSLYASVNPFDYGAAATNSQTAKAASAQALKLGNVSATSYLSQGSIDMKYFEFDINGANVQNYKQTGKDTIIASNYTVVGSPTISADGILSGTPDLNNCIKTPLDATNAKTMDIYLKFRVDESPNTSGQLYLYTFNDSAVGDGVPMFKIYHEYFQSNIQNKMMNVEKAVYSYEGHFSGDDGLTGTEKLYKNGELISDLTRTTMPSSWKKSSILWLGSGSGGSIVQINYPLSDFRVYLDGKLAWQPCLYIPYTATTDGTKIVDATYFDRVQSCREQTGQALYLTLDEQNQQYYLPQGTVSGMVSQNKQGLKELNAKIEQIKAQIGFTLFDTKITDHVLSGNDAVGWALQGSLVTNIYTDAVSNIASAYASGTDTTYREITCKRATDGRYIADIAQKEAIDELFENTGIADFYILDSANNQFYLPKSKWFMQLTTDSTAVNQYNESALPNITGTFNADQLYNGGGYGNGAFQYGGATSYPTPNSSSDQSQGGFNFNASRSSSVYTSGQTEVQPPSSNKLLYYKVGDTLTNDTAIDIGNMSNIISNLSTKTQIDEIVVNGNTWYRKYSNGFVEQAGFATGLSANTSTINLPVSMANTNYTILLSLANNTGGSSKNVGSIRSSSSSFTLYAESGERNNGIFWYVAGQGATS